jgi:hypothetical protein
MQKPLIMFHRSICFSAALGLLALTGCGSSTADDDDNAGGTGGTGATGGSGAGMPGAGGSVGGSAGSGTTGGSAGAGVSGSAGSGAGTSACNTGMFAASPEQNYQFSSTLTINLTPVKPSSDITFDWSGLTVDFLKKPVNFSTIGMVEIALWGMDISAFEKGLNDDTLNNPIVIAWIPATPDKQTGSIFDLHVPDGKLDMAVILDYIDINKYPGDKNLYTAMVADGTELGQGTRMLQGFKLDSTSTNQSVKIDSNSTKVDFTAKIAGRPETYIPAGTVAGLGIDWTKMRVTAAGLDFIPSSITRVRIGRYTQSVAELEGDNFLKLDEIADAMYEAKVDVGTKLTFDQLKNMKDQTPFPGIDAGHTWLVALNCGACQNPAPWYLSILKPCPAP